MELTTAAGVMAGGRLLLLGTSSLASSKSPRGLLLVLGLAAGSGAGTPSSSSVQACVGVGVVGCVFQYTHKQGKGKTSTTSIIHLKITCGVPRYQRSVSAERVAVSTRPAAMDSPNVSGC